MAAQSLRAFLLVTLACLAASCASTSSHRPRTGQPDFRFGRDTFAFENEVEALNPGKKDVFSLRCFVMSCSANRFWKFARFEPAAQRLSDAEYARLIRRVCHEPFYQPPREDGNRIVVPGYANLLEFSRDHTEAFRRHVGSKHISCLTYRNWRMSWGTTTDHQERTARQIREQLDRGLCDQVHIVNWPAIDHSALIYAYREFDDRVEFTSYDPNTLAAPLVFTWHKERRCFTMPKVAYYAGGRVTLHRIYHSWWR